VDSIKNHVLRAGLYYRLGPRRGTLCRDVTHSHAQTFLRSMFSTLFATGSIDAAPGFKHCSNLQLLGRIACCASRLMLTPFKGNVSFSAANVRTIREPPAMRTHVKLFLPLAVITVRAQTLIAYTHNNI